MSEFEMPFEALGRKKLRDSLSEAVESFSEKYRTVLMLRDVQHFSIAETAQVLGISEANVKTCLSRGRLQMGDALASAWEGTEYKRKTFQMVENTGFSGVPNWPRSNECGPYRTINGHDFGAATGSLWIWHSCSGDVLRPNRSELRTWERGIMSTQGRSDRF